MTVGSLFRIVYGLGATDFIPDFGKNFPGVNAAYARIEQQLRNLSDSIPLSQLEIAEKSKTVNPANQQP